MTATIGLSAGQRAWRGLVAAFRTAPDGLDATVVTEIFDCSQVPEDQRADIDNGNIWVEGMHQTLARLDALCTRQGNQPGPA